MQEKIIRALREETPLKARQIATKIGEKRQDVSSFLHDHADQFEQDNKYRWAIKQVEIRFPPRWVTAAVLEGKLSQAGCPLTSKTTSFQFVFPKNSLLLLEASSRLLALCNQLINTGKNVALDFSGNTQTLTYLDRSGFLSHLHEQVQVIPDVSRGSRLNKHRDQSDSLFEVRAIDPSNYDDGIPEQLKDKFVSKAGEKYTHAAFLFFSELVLNVVQHSRTPAMGFAALQAYGRPRPHIQVVVSDSGVGILGTLSPTLADRYPDLDREFDLLDPDHCIKLIRLMIEEGGISSRKKGDGMGLKRSWDLGQKFKATMTVRQENIELVWSLSRGETVLFTSQRDLPLIHGTHICFDFEY